MATQVQDAAERSRYEASVDSQLAGFAAYTERDDVRLLTHTEVFDAYEGQGVGSALAKGALDDVRARGLKVVPLCSFVRAYIGRHPEYADLVTDGAG
jgi:predicted GNAT family acetyltransferase